MATTTRSYGVTNAPGVRVNETSGVSPIVDGDLGNATVIGVFERGEPGSLIDITGPSRIKRTIGELVDGSIAPDAVDDFFDYSDGAGRVQAVRVTDGTEVASSVTLYSRGAGYGFSAPNAQTDDQSQVPVPLMTLAAKDGGRWGGRQRVLDAEITISAMTETTVPTNKTMLLNEFAGATVTFWGMHATSGSKSYTVVSNTTAGVLTLDSDAIAKTDVQEGSSQLKVTCSAFLGTATLDGNLPKGLQAVVRDGGVDPLNNFGLDVYLDGEKVHGWDDLSCDPSSEFYFVDVINNDDANLEVVASDLLPAGSSITPDHRPANLYSQVKDVTASKVTISPVVIAQDDTAGVAIPVSYSFHSAVVSGAAELLPTKVVLTWVAASNHYTVEFQDLTRPGQDLSPSNNFSVGAAPQYNATYTSENPLAPNLVFDHPTDPSDGDQIVLYVIPPTSEALGGFIFPDAKSAQFTKFKVSSRDYESFSVQSGDPSTTATAAAVAAVTGSQTETFNITGGSNDAFTVAVDGRPQVAVTLTAGATQSAQDIADDINAAFDAQFGASVLNPATAVGGAVVLTSPGGWDGGGPSSSIEVVTVANDAYTTLGFSVGTTYGAKGTEIRLQCRQQLCDGYDGGSPDLNDYLSVLADGTGAYASIQELELGNLMMLVPGVTDDLGSADAIALQKRCFEVCEEQPFTYLAEFPDDKVTETAIQSYLISDLGRTDMGLTYVPSFVMKTDPDAASRLKKVSSLAVWAGLCSGQASIVGGYFNPPAGKGFPLRTVRKLPSGYTQALDEEILRPLGVNVIKKKSGDFIFSGVRTLSSNRAWKQIGPRMQMNHYVWVLRNNVEDYVFELNDEMTRAQLRLTLTDYFEAQTSLGALGRADGETPYSVKVDSDNNTQATIDAGQLVSDIRLTFTKVVEQVVVNVGPQAVTETVI